MEEKYQANQSLIGGLFERPRPWHRGYKVLFAICCLAVLVHLIYAVGRVGSKIGDYDVNREFGRRFLAGEYLYDGGQCFNYMPISALYWSPLALVPPAVGIFLRYLTALACLALIIRMLRMMAYPGERSDSLKSLSVTWVSLFLGLHYLIRDFDDGGPHVILLAIMLGGVYCVCFRREKLGAIWLGLAIAVKITPGLFLPFFLWKRQWRVFTYTCAATLLWIVLPALWMGPTSWWHHQRQWNQVALSVADDSSNELRVDNEQRVQNQALKPAILRFLLTLPVGHSMRLEQPGYVDFLNLSPTIASRVASFAMLALIGLLCWRSRIAWNTSKPGPILGETSALLCLMLLFSPVTWLQHFVFALPAIYWIIAHDQSKPQILTRWVIGIYVVLALLMNREVLGREHYLLLLSYHTHTICLLLLFSLVLAGLHSRTLQKETECPGIISVHRNQAA
jgi:hypothetical protein